MNLNQIFNTYPKDQRKELFKLGLISSNTIMMNYLIKSKQKLNLNQEEIFMICRQGMEKSFNYLKGKVDFTSIKHSQTGNSCAHIAGQYGNLQALKYLKKEGFDFGKLNNRHQTALAYSLKNNQRLFQPTISFLGKQTPLGIKDEQNNLSYQVYIQMDQSKARLIEWLKERQSGN